MIKGIGLDLVELERIKRHIEKDNRLVNRILTEHEQKVFKQKQSLKRKTEYLAGRFAAKEAFAKAVGSGIGKLSFQHIEILSDENGAPFLKAKGYEANRIFISITHTSQYAAAQVVIEEK